MNENRETTNLQNSRPTIGVFLGGLYSYSFSVWFGIADVAQEQDVNLISFVDQFPWTAWESRTQSPTVYDLANAENIQGLIVLPTVSVISASEMENFYQRYVTLPRVSIGRAVENVPSVLVDDEKGIFDLMDHLIVDHGCRRIAFIKGPEDNPEAARRYRAYAQALAQYDLALDPDLITSGYFSVDTGMEAADLLLDRRNVALDAIVAANDEMAWGAMEALERRGIRVPDDVAVTGFDDREESKYTVPPLTTIRQPVYELGRRAAELVLAQLRGEKVPLQTTLATEVVARRSCGCLPQVVRLTGTKNIETSTAENPGIETLAPTLTARREQILHEMAMAQSPSYPSVAHRDRQDPAAREYLLDGLIAEFAARSRGEPADIFLPTLDEILRQAATTGCDVIVWQEPLSILRRQTLPHLTETSALLQTERLWRQAQVLLGDVVQQAQAQQRWQAEEQAQIRGEISQSLLATFDVNGLMDVLAQALPRLGIESCYLALHDTRPESANTARVPEWSRLLLAFTERGRLALESGGQRFRSLQLVPQEMLPFARRYALLVTQLYFDDAQLGFVIFEMGSQQSGIYEDIRGQLGRALKGVLLLEERKQAKAALEKAYAEVEKQVQERTAKLQQEIAERKRAAEELERYREHLEELVKERTRELEDVHAELVRQERLSALGQLTATVAHEIRNPLSTVRTAVFTIGDAIERKQTKRIARLRQLAERNIIRCDRIIKELLDYTRDPKLEPQPTSIDAWLDEVLDEQTIPGGIVCVRELTCGVEIAIDRERLCCAIDNVVENGVYALQDKGASGNQLTVSTHVVGVRLEIRVSDTGRGIPADVRTRIFEPLFSTKSFGVGLGLPIVKNIMKQHGGGIQVNSEVDAGTTVTLWLPISNNGGD